MPNVCVPFNSLTVSHPLQIYKITIDLTMKLSTNSWIIKWLHYTWLQPQITLIQSSPWSNVKFKGTNDNRSNKSNRFPMNNSGFVQWSFHHPLSSSLRDGLPDRVDLHRPIAVFVGIFVSLSLHISRQCRHPLDCLVRLRKQPFPQKNRILNRRSVFRHFDGSKPPRNCSVNPSKCKSLRIW